jgi:hypothetical protein
MSTSFPTRDPHPAPPPQNPTPLTHQAVGCTPGSLPLLPAGPDHQDLCAQSAGSNAAEHRWAGGVDAPGWGVGGMGTAGGRSVCSREEGPAPSHQGASGMLPKPLAYLAISVPPLHETDHGILCGFHHSKTSPTPTNDTSPIEYTMHLCKAKASVALHAAPHHQPVPAGRHERQQQTL